MMMRVTDKRPEFVRGRQCSNVMINTDKQSLSVALRNEACVLKY